MSQSNVLKEVKSDKIQINVQKIMQEFRENSNISCGSLKLNEEPKEKQFMFYSTLKKKERNKHYEKRFDEVSIISYGSYGVVFKAMDKKIKKMFAIKKIPIDEKTGKSILREINILSDLKSEFIVNIEDAWTENNYYNIKGKFPFLEHSMKHEILKSDKNLLLHIQMELCDTTLKEIIEILNKELIQKPNEVMSPLRYFIASELFIEILEAVDYLHKLKIIHRDLKPSNIFLTNGLNGKFIKLADFGLATLHEYDGQSHTNYLGTYGYVAPEVMNTRKYDTRADIYSLGAILIKLYNNIDLYNDKIKLNTNLDTKYSNLFDLALKMYSVRKSERPDCEEILSTRKDWALNLYELINDYGFKHDKSDESFHSKFLKLKIRHHEITENKSKKLED